MNTENRIHDQLIFKRVPKEGLEIPMDQTGRWHRWLVENGYWLGDFCNPGCYEAELVTNGDGTLRIYPPRA